MNLPGIYQYLLKTGLTSKIDSVHRQTIDEAALMNKKRI